MGGPAQDRSECSAATGGLGSAGAAAGQPDETRAPRQPHLPGGIPLAHGHWQLQLHINVLASGIPPDWGTTPRRA